MDMIDEIYTEHPYYGYRRIRETLRRKGHRVNRKRVQRLMNLLGLQGICPKRNLSKPRKDHKKYPYLLRGVPIERSNQVWSSDITYCRLRGGYVYLTAIMDWFSKKVLSWRVSNSMEASFCIEDLTEALSKYGKPEIFNTDQGPQYTCNAFLSILEANEIQISMDGRGRALDNIFVERLWRSVKYEKIYLNEYSSVPALKSGLEDYFSFYNQERPHQSLGYQTPDEVYENKTMEFGSRVPRLLLPSLEFIHGTGKLEKKTLQECVVILNNGRRIPTKSLENYV